MVEFFFGYSKITQETDVWTHTAQRVIDQLFSGQRLTTDVSPFAGD